MTGNIPEAKQRIVGTRRKTKTGDKGRERAREGAYRKKEKRKKVRICRVVLIMTTGVITCNYRKEWLQRSMSAALVDEDAGGRREESRPVQKQPKEKGGEKKSSRSKGGYLRVRESGHAIKTMTVKIF